MQSFAELDHVKSCVQLTPDTVRSFAQVIFPARASDEQLSKERKILAGGRVPARAC
jgi:hypothetical protein